MPLLDVTSELCDPRSHVIKGALSWGFCCVQASSVLKSLLSTFTRTQNAPAELRRRSIYEIGQ